MAEMWDQAQAEFTLTIRSSIGVFEASGTITRESFDAALKRFYHAYPIEQPRLDITGVVVLYDRCRFLLGMTDMLAVYNDISENGLPIKEVPLALVVPEWVFGMAKEYTAYQRQQGVIREAFLCRDAAMEWVEKQVALLALQHRSRHG